MFADLTWSRVSKGVLSLNVVVNIGLGIYFSWYHQSGQATILTYLRSHIDKNQHSGELKRFYPNLSFTQLNNYQLENPVKSKLTVTSENAYQPFVIYSLLPCHNFYGYTHFHEFSITNQVVLKQLECPPYRFRTQSDKFIYQNGDKRVPGEQVLEKHRVNKISNFVLLFEGDAIKLKSWLNRHAFQLKFCVYHTNTPIGDNHDKQILSGV